MRGRREQQNIPLGNFLAATELRGGKVRVELICLVRLSAYLSSSHDHYDKIMYGTSQTSLSMLAYGEKGNSNTYQSSNFEKERGSNTDVTLTRHASSVIYTVRLNNLAPGTIYYYRCGDSASPSLSPILSFATLPAADLITDSKGSSMVSAISVEKNVRSAILTTAATSPYDIAVTVTGVTKAQADTAAFKSDFITPTAAALGIATSAINVISVTEITARRTLIGDKATSLRALSASSSVLLRYTVSISASLSETLGALRDSVTAVNNYLNSRAYSASVGFAFSDTSSSAPSSAPTPNKFSCFAASETVSLQSGALKAISSVRVGDIVLAASASGKTSFSEVVYVPHKSNKQRALFVHIATESGHDVKVTKNHVLPAGVCGSVQPLVYASQVCVGECIMTVSGEERVSAVESVRGEGVYTIVTKEEFIVVNGVIASPFGANHMLANLYYNVHRFLYALSPVLLTSNLLHAANEGLGMAIPFFGSI